MWLHFIQEIICGIIGISIYLLVNPIQKKRPDLESLYWFSRWGLWLGILTLTHAITAVLPNINNATFIPLTYLPERIGDSILAMLCVYPIGHLSKKIFGISKKVWTNIVAFIIYAAVVAFGIYSDQQSMFGGVLGRPQEILQLIPACIVFGRLIDTKTEFAKMLKWGTLATAFGGIIMAFSHNLFDCSFILAHNFKIISYIVMFSTVIWVRTLYKRSK